MTRVTMSSREPFWRRAARVLLPRDVGDGFPVCVGEHFEQFVGYVMINLALSYGVGTELVV